MSPVKILKTSLRWPNGVEGCCPICGNSLIGGVRVMVLDARFYHQKVAAGEVKEGDVYAHALCVQEECVETKSGYFPLVHLA